METVGGTKVKTRKLGNRVNADGVPKIKVIAAVDEL